MAFFFLQMNITTAPETHCATFLCHNTSNSDMSFAWHMSIIPHSWTLAYVAHLDAWSLSTVDLIRIYQNSCNWRDTSMSHSISPLEQHVTEPLSIFKMTQSSSTKGFIYFGQFTMTNNECLTEPPCKSAACFQPHMKMYSVKGQQILMVQHSHGGQKSVIGCGTVHLSVHHACCTTHFVTKKQPQTGDLQYLFSQIHVLIVFIGKIQYSITSNVSIKTTVKSLM